MMFKTCFVFAYRAGERRSDHNWSLSRRVEKHLDGGADGRRAAAATSEHGLHSKQPAKELMRRQTFNGKVNFDPVLFKQMLLGVLLEASRRWDTDIWILYSTPAASCKIVLTCLFKDFGGILNLH